jgi:protein TonB
MTMHFSDMGNGKHGNTGKFVLVAGLHVAVGVLFVHSLSTRHLSLPFMPDPVTVVLQADPPAPPTPVDPPSPTQQLAPPPTLFVPPPEIPVAAPPEPAPTVTATSAEAQPPQPAQPAQPAADPGPPATATPHGASPGQMRSAVFADANGCALPSYPAKAAREGESGTTMLALLVGADGRVSSARVQHSSGSRDLDRAALQALSLCKFKPATTNGVPEAGWAQLAYVWTLD